MGEVVIYQIVRNYLKGLLNTCGIKQANERALKKSAYCTTFVILDGAGEVENYSICSDMHIWQPQIVILFHNGADREKLHEDISIIKNKIIENVDTPSGILELGNPISWEEVEIEDNKVKLTITLSARAAI